MNGTREALLVVIVLVLAAGCATRRTPAPVVDASAHKAAASRSAAAAAAPVPAPPGRPMDAFYTVKRGDTLYSIALEHGADYRELAQWNHLDDPTKIRVGQQLRVKPAEPERQVQIGSARILGRVESRPLEEASKPAPSPAPQPAARAGPAPQITKEHATQEGAAAQFMWPAKGKLLARFSETRSKGIDIEGQIGDPVVAAAGGRVILAQQAGLGLGNLVVIKHNDGFITVYAHNKTILVKEQQNVSRGQRIAEVGDTDSKRAKLHFQIRRAGVPVDPLLYLPSS